MTDLVPKSKAGNRLVVVGVAILVLFLALLAMNEAMENAGLLVLVVALIPAVAAARQRDAFQVYPVFSY